MDPSVLYDRKRRGDKENDEDISVQGRLYGDYLPSHPDSRVASEQKAKLIEQRKVHFLHRLLVKAKEVLALFRILLTPNGAPSHPSKSLNGAISKLSDRQRQRCVSSLTQRTWAYLVTQHAGKELLNEFVEATIRSQTAQMAERMARRLTSECGSFYSPIEQRLLRVEERLKFSKESEVKTSRSQALVESEQTLIEAGKRLRERVRKHSNEEPSQMLESVVGQYMRKLEAACETYTSLGEVSRVQKVTLRSAAMFASCTNDDISRPMLDVTGRGDDTGEEEAKGFGSKGPGGKGGATPKKRLLRSLLRRARGQCYQMVVKSLRTLMEAARELPPSDRSVTNTQKSGSMLGAQNTFTAQERKEHADQLLNLSLQSNDRWFHNTIYDFFFVRLTLRHIGSEARREQILCCMFLVLFFFSFLTHFVFCYVQNLTHTYIHTYKQAQQDHTLSTCVSTQNCFLRDHHHPWQTHNRNSIRSNFL